MQFSLSLSLSRPREIGEICRTKVLWSVRKEKKKARGGDGGIMPPMQRRGNRCAANSRSAESNRLKTGRKQLLSLSLSLSLSRRSLGPPLGESLLLPSVIHNPRRRRRRRRPRGLPINPCSSCFIPRLKSRLPASVKSPFLAAPHYIIHRSPLRPPRCAIGTREDRDTERERERERRSCSTSRTAATAMAVR